MLLKLYIRKGTEANLSKGIYNKEFTCGCSALRFLKKKTSDIRSYGTLRKVDWLFITDVSGQPIGLIFKDQA
jgi:hypothetical protein